MPGSSTYKCMCTSHHIHTNPYGQHQLKVSCGFWTRMVVYVSKLCYSSYPLISKLRDSKLKLYLISMVGRDSSIGITTRYRRDGPGIKSLWGRDFPHLSRPALGPTQLPVHLVPGVKRLGRGVDYPPSSSAEVKWRVQL